PVVRSSDGESGTVTQLEVPLNDRAPPYLPDVDHVVLETVPLLALPERSLTAEPVPSSKESAATRPVPAAWAPRGSAPAPARSGRTSRGRSKRKRLKPGL